MDASGSMEETWYIGEMIRRGIVVLGLLVLTVGCSFAKQQVKSNADAECGKSCKNQPADTQGECIARCTK